MAAMKPSLPTDIVNQRFTKFVTWQSLQTTVVFALLFVLSSSLLHRRFFSFQSIFSFILFYSSFIFFAFAVAFSSFPNPCRPASSSELFVALFRLLLVPGGEASASDFRNRARVYASLVLFVAVSAMSGFLSAVSLCGWIAGMDYFSVNMGLRGFFHGIIYGIYYIYKRRWVLDYPIIQRPIFFSFKMGILNSIQLSLKLSTTAFLFSAIISSFVLYHFTCVDTTWTLVKKQLIFYFENFVIFLSWESTHHLHQIIFTKRFVFAPPKGSAAAETNPSENLLMALEGTPQGHLLHFLSYLDLCMVCENNVELWRRAAFFEETGGTFRRVISACLRPLERFSSEVANSLETRSTEVSTQLMTPECVLLESKQGELFQNFQVCVWGARAAASLTAASHREDRFGVAQLSGSNATVMSALISSLLAVEALTGKKTETQHAHQPKTIRWAVQPADRRGVAGTGSKTKEKSGRLDPRAYALADVLRTSVYSIVSVFHGEMAVSRAGILERDWVVMGTPCYGSREQLLHKLGLFLKYEAC